jgi:hypothetical protein
VGKTSTVMLVFSSAVTGPALAAEQAAAAAEMTRTRAAPATAGQRKLGNLTATPTVREIVFHGKCAFPHTMHHDGLP